MTLSVDSREHDPFCRLLENMTPSAVFGPFSNLWISSEHDTSVVYIMEYDSYVVPAYSLFSGMKTN